MVGDEETGEKEIMTPALLHVLLLAWGCGSLLLVWCGSITWTQFLGAGCDIIRL